MAKTNSEVSFEVKKVIGNVGEKKMLKVMSWNGKEAKLDLRDWWTDKDGNEKCGKGICLSNEEAKELVNLLSNYLEEDEKDDF